MGAVSNPHIYNMKISSHNLLFVLAIIVTVVSTDAEPKDEETEQDKKRGGKLMRYGRGSVMSHEKRASLMRYGRAHGFDGYDQLNNEKRLFRYGKRADEDESKSIAVPYGKNTDDNYLFNDEKRGTVFRYGKRSGIDDILAEAKRRIMRYGREIRASQEPHVPFRFG